jgi:2-polyprenyl-3-methyl-5-hydroxy-6-metoxy-1,4-benzoquinol methylase
VSTPRPCPLCHGARSSRIERYAPAEWDVVRCEDCGFVFLRNPLPYAELEENAAWEKTFAEKKKRGGSTPFSKVNAWLRSLVRNFANARKRREQHRLFPEGRVLDVGCGGATRAEPPLIPYGIEISRSLQLRSDADMRARGGFCLLGAGAEAIWDFEPDFFDGAILNSYLEHEAEPERILRGLFRALKPGGSVFVRVPNYGSLNRLVVGAKWCGFRHPDHVNYFTRASLAQMAEKVGFKTEILNPRSLWLDDNIKAALHRP